MGLEDLTPTSEQPQPETPQEPASPPPPSSAEPAAEEASAEALPVEVEPAGALIEVRIEEVGPEEPPQETPPAEPAAEEEAPAEAPPTEAPGPEAAEAPPEEEGAEAETEAVEGEAEAEPAPQPPPKAEWLNLEPPEEDTDRVSHEVKLLRAINDEWTVQVGSVRGKLHAHHGKWREDSFRVGGVDAWTILAVSDGAGSASLSRVGARVACEEAVKALKAHLAGYVMQPSGDMPSAADLRRLQTFLAWAAFRAKTGILREAGQRGCSERDLHATFLVAVHTPWHGRDLVAAVQAGDGEVAVYSDDGSCTLLGEADHGEYAGQAKFLTTPNIEYEFENRVKLTIKDGLRAIAVMCDGVSDDFFPEAQRLVELFVGDPIEGMATRDGEPVRGLLHTVVEDAQDGQRLLDWLRYEKRGSSDDRTLVLMYRSG